MPETFADDDAFYALPDTPKDPFKDMQNIEKKKEKPISSKDKSKEQNAFKNPFLR
jgi:hypothetical protein